MTQVAPPALQKVRLVLDSVWEVLLAYETNAVDYMCDSIFF
jgi:hypothetical protein